MGAVLSVLIRDKFLRRRQAIPMKIPPPDMTLPAEVRVAYVVGWQDGYRRGFKDGNPGRKKTSAKSEAARLNGAKGGRPKKEPDSEK